MADDLATYAFTRRANTDVLAKYAFTREADKECFLLWTCGQIS